ncbi:MAG: PEP-CTERM sorting domain-containing protein [Capsulimonas sp.]|uniref:PEP-CTERM sorting domain-containing protein n=1 Tax=Capsulimonas sp. TaxID=2494211 RepID=UPI0032676A1C
MKLRSSNFVALAGIAVTLLAAPSAHAAYVFVGSWDLGTVGGGYDNPGNPYIWSNNSQVFTGQEAAAALFGGNASDYAISTVDADAAHINHLTFVDGWGDTQYLYNPASETFSVDMGAPGYSDPGGVGSSYSALVTDHAPFEGSGSFVNYAFRNVSAVPEPSTNAVMMLGGLTVLGMVFLRRRSAQS